MAVDVSALPIRQLNKIINLTLTTKQLGENNDY
jgi:hypothetical protein